MPGSIRALPPATLVLLAACAGTPGPASTSFADLQGSYQLVEAEVPTGARVPTLTIESSGRVHGNSGVNRYTAALDTAALGRGEWRAGAQASTRMAGTEDAMLFEATFLRALSAADAVAVEDGLVVLRSRGAPMLKFQAVH